MRNLEVCCFLSSLLLEGIYLHILLNLLLGDGFFLIALSVCKNLVLKIYFVGLI